MDYVKSLGDKAGDLVGVHGWPLLGGLAGVGMVYGTEELVIGFLNRNRWAKFVLAFGGGVGVFMVLSNIGAKIS